ncbi:hypothetical protein GTGU_02592 [Trabulsiella guamensis ATCC 49490]|uniref:DUF4225 domain-containing protein n=3 Tax=Trabulsiella TaxID=158851 RepID=A0A085A896_9ENTR|nr:hypothetical protein GTGU_02592 [Trabulsiella guamensis ATCC 49490]
MMWDVMKENFEQAKKEYLRASLELWGSDPFLFEQAKMMIKVREVIRSVEEDIQRNCFSLTGGVDVLKYKAQVLRYQKRMVVNNKIYSRHLAELAYKEERKKELQTLFTKIVGFLAGFGQTATGTGICIISEGMGAATGTAMIIQGINNIYENGYYLVAYEEASGPLREAYRYSFNKMGLDPYADAAYGVADLVFSGYGLARHIPTPREKSWSLFGIKSHQTDYIRGIQEMSKPALLLEVVSDVTTVISVLPAIQVDK